MKRKIDFIDIFLPKEIDIYNVLSRVHLVEGFFRVGKLTCKSEKFVIIMTSIMGFRESSLA